MKLYSTTATCSPHCDAVWKLGSHIFYFNEDWNPGWGGETLVLDDGGRFSRRSAPDFDDFVQQRLEVTELSERPLNFAPREFVALLCHDVS